MESALHYVTMDDIEKIKNNILPDSFIGEIDFSDIHSDDDYLNKIGTIFRFPVFEGQTGHSWNGYSDWMRDLYWENDKEWMNMTKNGYNLIIYNCDVNGYTYRYNKLLREIIDSFVYTILPWWRKDVVNCVVEGEPKPFNVYLVL